MWSQLEARFCFTPQRAREHGGTRVEPRLKQEGWPFVPPCPSVVGHNCPQSRHNITSQQGRSAPAGAVPQTRGRLGTVNSSIQPLRNGCPTRKKDLSGPPAVSHRGQGGGRDEARFMAGPWISEVEESGHHLVVGGLRYTLLTGGSLHVLCRLSTGHVSGHHSHNYRMHSALASCVGGYSAPNQQGK